MIGVADRVVLVYPRNAHCASLQTEGFYVASRVGGVMDSRALIEAAAMEQRPMIATDILG